MQKILFLYFDKDGQSFAIASQMALQLAQLNQNIAYEIYDFQKKPTINLENYSSVIVGVTSYCNKFNKPFLAFVKKNYLLLNRQDTALFIVNLAARHTDQNTLKTNSCACQLLDKMLWKPKLVDVFAGAIYYPRYSWCKKLLINGLMRLKGEKQQLTSEYIYTNKSRVISFTRQFVQLVNGS